MITSILGQSNALMYRIRHFYVEWAPDCISPSGFNPGLCIVIVIIITIIVSIIINIISIVTMTHATYVRLMGKKKLGPVQFIGIPIRDGFHIIMMLFN